MNLLPLVIQLGAIVAQPIAAISGLAFPLRYVAAWSARAVVMMDALGGWFFNLIDGIKLCYFRHVFPFGWGFGHQELISTNELSTGFVSQLKPGQAGPTPIDFI
jgi:hypothetical protein